MGLSQDHAHIVNNNHVINTDVSPLVDSLAHREAGNSTKTASPSLQAIYALCLRTAPNVIPCKIIRECLLGQVILGSYSLGNNQFLPVVVKEFNLYQALNKTTRHGHKLQEDALTELQIHAAIQQKQIKNVIGLYGMHVNEKSNKLHAYLEYAAKGELFSIVQKRIGGLPVTVCGNFLVQLLYGIAGLHSINVVHRDLSLENILVTQDNEIKICDFGLAAMCAPGDTIRDGRVVGKVNYMCPEVYYREEYDPRMVDIWSAGVIFFLMLTGIVPYERPSVDDPRLLMICNGRINELLAQWKRPLLDKEQLQVLSKMLCPPQDRWHAQQLLQLSFCKRFANVSTADISAALADKNTGQSEAQTNKTHHFERNAPPMSTDSNTSSRVPSMDSCAAVASSNSSK